MTDRDAISDDDVAFFRLMTRDVKPLHYEERVHGPSFFRKPPIPSVLPPSPIRQPFQFALSDGAEPDLPTDAKGSPYFCRGGTGGKILQKLKKQTSIIDATLDLHGLCIEKARLAFDRFFSRAVHNRMHCVKVIHGKGFGSVNQMPVLKQKVRIWLTQMSIVSAFHEAPPHEGGAGAVLVLLRL